MEVSGDRPLLRIGELSLAPQRQRPRPAGVEEPLRSAAAGALTGGPVTEAEQAGPSR
jgi:hypothetical protein